MIPGPKSDPDFFAKDAALAARIREAWPIGGTPIEQPEEEEGTE